MTSPAPSLAPSARGLLPVLARGLLPVPARFAALARSLFAVLALGMGGAVPTTPTPLAAQAPAAGHAEVDTLIRDGVSIHWERAGEGPAILFLHDGLNHGGVWDAAFGALARDHQVVRFDRRGYGRSDSPTEPYSPVDDVSAVLNAAGMRQAVLVGASWGGGLALEFALAQPGRVRALVLVGAVVPGYGYSEHFTSRGFRNTAPLLDGKPGRALDNWVDDPWLVAPGNKEARRRLRRLLEPWFEKHMAQRPDLVRLPEPSLLGRLAEIEVPTLVLVGEADIPDVHAHAGVLETELPDARRVVVDGSGHLLHLERPEEFERLLRAFLEGL